MIRYFYAFALATALSAPAFAQKPEKPNLDKLLYGDLGKIKSFFMIYARVEGTDPAKRDKNEIGLDDDQLTEFLRLRFKNNFAQIPYKENYDYDMPVKEREEMGLLWCRAWTVGSTYPIAYHVKCMIGSKEKAEIISDETLGLGSRDVALQAIRSSMDRMVTKFAVMLFRMRGEI